MFPFVFKWSLAGDVPLCTVLHCSLTSVKEGRLGSSRPTLTAGNWQTDIYTNSKSWLVSRVERSQALHFCSTVCVPCHTCRQKVWSSTLTELFKKPIMLIMWEHGTMSNISLLRLLPPSMIKHTHIQTLQQMCTRTQTHTHRESPLVITCASYLPYQRTMRRFAYIPLSSPEPWIYRLPLRQSRLCCCSETHTALLSWCPDQTLMELSRGIGALWSVVSVELDAEMWEC